MKMNTIKKYSLRVGMVIVCIFVILLLAMSYFPKQTSHILNIYLYPASSSGSISSISKNSLVVSSLDNQLEVGDTVSFSTVRFGKNDILTQKVEKVYNSQSEEVSYKTSNHNKKNPEEYVVKKKDIIGKYLFHIPYLGLLMIFMKSKYMIILVLCLIQVILYSKLRRIYKLEEKKEKKPKRHYIMIKNMCIEHVGNEMIISGEIENQLEQSVKCVVAQLEVYDRSKNKIVNEEWDVLEQKALSSGQSIKFAYRLPYIEDVVDYALRIRKYKY